MWVREMFYRDERSHTIEYQFLCQSCKKQSGPVFRKITAIHQRQYPGHFTLSAEDQAALPIIMQGKLENVLLLTWVSFERGEYNFLPGFIETKEQLGDYGINKWKAVCPHCNSEQVWVPKRKLFGKAEPIDSAFLPRINWHWEGLSPNITTHIEWIKREYSMYFTDKKHFSVNGSYGLNHSKINNDERAWAYVVPGLHLELIKDLLDDYDPRYFALNSRNINAENNLPRKNRPEINRGDECYGFVSFQNGEPVTRWAFSSEHGIIYRTSIMPLERRHPS